VFLKTVSSGTRILLCHCRTNPYILKWSSQGPEFCAISDLSVETDTSNLKRISSIWWGEFNKSNIIIYQSSVEEVYQCGSIKCSISGGTLSIMVWLLKPMICRIAWNLFDVSANTILGYLDKVVDVKFLFSDHGFHSLQNFKNYWRITDANIIKSYIKVGI